MCHTTGFAKAEITELCARIETRELAPGMRKWPPILGLRNYRRPLATFPETISAVVALHFYATA